ncbi:hypothetical protein [Mycobacterium sp. E2479]|uniref:hypothetical protein n=1 Tax=Mycobacterium sp. E2479 TaxID=1834134 RepID=UPI0008016A77|nr:hypothetical protein [Mycobacterium sp. E2479]OBH50004.1 hypothetical protein A5686_14700 [Mycobacterium sp. E2479]
MHDPEGPEADHRGRAEATDPNEPQSTAGATASASELDEDNEVAQAEARAEAARARVLQLREAAETAPSQDVEQRPPKWTRKRLPLRGRGRPRWLRRPGRKTIAAGVGIVLAAASLGASGYMVWQHNVIAHKRQLAAEFTAAATQRVTALMSIDANHAKEDFQRVIDDSTGDFKNQISVMSGLMAKQAAQSKARSKATVEAVAVESLTDDSAVVLVAAKSDVTNADNTMQPPVVWRLSVDLKRDGGRLKMSKVDFLQ